MDPIHVMTAILLASPMLLFAVHAAVSRIMRGVSPQIVVVLSMGVASIPVGSILWAFALHDFKGQQGGLYPAILYAMIVYGGIAYSYFHLFNMSETARRIRIFYEIHKAGSLTAKEIISLYGTNDIISVRLERLVVVKQLGRRKGVYIVKGRTLYYVALWVRAWGALLGFSWVK